MTVQPTLDAVFFFFFGVFMDSPFGAMEAAAATLGVDRDLLVDTVFGSYDADTDHPWHRLERGEIELAHAVDAIGKIALGNGLGNFDIFGALAGMVRDGSDRTFMVEVVQRLRGAGVRTSIITNNLKEFGSVWRAHIDVDELFDDVVDSCEVGLRKPNVAIFELAVERLGVSAERSAFIDDFEPNVAAARSVGMHGVWCGYENATTRSAAAELLRLAGLD